MNLSTLTGDAKPYLEYGWVCAPNTAGQSITANTITTLTIDTEVADTGNFGSIASNQITLAAGTYYYTIYGHFGATSGMVPNGILGLYNVTGASYISRRAFGAMSNHGETSFVGQFTITSSTVFDLRVSSHSYPFTAASWDYTYQGTLATAGTDQRTTIKLWKLA